jgi:hypothetical protein
MSLKSFWEEEKQARKQRKLEKKLSKKSPLTGEQKFIKIAGIITGILITFGALFFSCKSLFGGDFDWNEIVGITDEMIEELEKPVDENLLFADGRILAEDYNSCKVKLNSANANVIDSKESELEATSSFSLNSKEVGALVNLLLSESEELGTMSVLDFNIFFENDYFYEKSITLVDLNEVVGSEEKKLPKVYLTAVSKIEVLNGQISVLDTELKINAIEDGVNEDIIELLKKYTNFTLVSASNTTINMVIDLFADEVKTKVVLMDNGIEFKI